MNKEDTLIDGLLIDLLLLLGICSPPASVAPRHLLLFGICCSSASHSASQAMSGDKRAAQ